MYFPTVTSPFTMNCSSFQEQTLKFLKVFNDCHWVTFKHPREFGEAMDRKKKHSLAYYCYVNEAKSLQCMIINGICSSASCDQHHLRLGVISPTHTHSAIPFSNELQYLPLQDQPVNYSKCKTSLINF